MRSDMAKVIVERPRRGSRIRGKPKGYRRKLGRLSAEGTPVREGMKRRWQNQTKSLNEHLGPLRRYLDSQVGRPWNKVFSEICAHINRNSAVQDHVRDHVDDYVATHVVSIDGVLFYGHGWYHGRPLHELAWVGWYVCPRTGILRRNKAFRRYKKKAPSQEVSYPPVNMGDTLQCRFFGGAWHLVTLEPLPLMPSHKRVLNRPVTEISEEMARKHYGKAVYAVAVRRLSRRELRQYPIPVDAWK